MYHLFIQQPTKTVISSCFCCIFNTLTYSQSTQNGKADYLALYENYKKSFKQDVTFAKYISISSHLLRVFLSSCDRHRNMVVVILLIESPLDPEILRNN